MFLSQYWNQMGKPQPIYRATFVYDAGGGGDYYDLQIEHVEQESSYTFQEISMGNMYGGSQQQGHLFQGKIYVRQNHLHQQLIMLEAMKGKRIAAALELGWPDGVVTGMPYRDKRRVLFAVTPSADLSAETDFSFKNKLSFTYTIESVPERPRVIISLSGFVDLRPDVFPQNH